MAGERVASGGHEHAVCAVRIAVLRPRVREGAGASKKGAREGGREKRRKKEKEGEGKKERERRRGKEGGCTPYVLRGCHAKVFALDHFWARLTVRTPDRVLLAGKVDPATRRLSAGLGLQDVDLRAVHGLVICRCGHGGYRDWERI